MKPVQLEIQAFGPFAAKESIDFTKLGESPLFLINGPTGAGKSSILDAICFALYGQTTGAEREASQMRCDHSERSLLTEVTFEFSLADKTYRIRRAPTQERPKSRGEGTTTQQAQAQLWELDGSEEGRLIVSKSVKEADAEILNIIGLGVDQFRQVMVLPQGKFRELLMADSKERENIFSQLFETQIYKKIENKLKEQASGIRQAVEKHHNEVRGILQATSVESEDELQAEIVILTPKLQASEAHRGEVSKQLNTIRSEHEAGLLLNKRFDDLINKQKELEAYKGKAAEYKNKATLLDQSLKAQSIYHVWVAQQRESEQLNSVRQQSYVQTGRLELIKEEHEQATKQVNEAKLAAESLDTIKTQHADLLRHLVQNTELHTAIDALKSKETQLALCQKEQRMKQQTCDQLESELADNTRLMETYGKETEQLIPLELQLKQLTLIAEDRQQLERLRQNEVDLNSKKEVVEQNANTKRLQLNATKRNATQTEIAWHQGQAILLAKELEDDQPCPVCGSQDHPEPAQANSTLELVTKQQVEETRYLEAKAREEVQSAKDVITQIDNQQAVLISQQKDLIKRLGHYADKALDEINVEIHQIQSRVDELQTKKAQWSELCTRVKAIKEQCSQIQQILLGLQTNSNDANTEVIASKTRVEHLESQIPEKYRDRHTLTLEITNISQQVERLTSQLERAVKNQNEKQSQLDQAISTEQSLSAHLKEQTLTTEQASSAWQKTLEQSPFENTEMFNAARLEEAQQATLTHEINSYQMELDRLKGVVQQLEQDVAGKQRFDEVTAVEKIQQVEAEFKGIDDQWRQYQARIDALNKTHTMLEKAKSENERLNQQYAIYGTLNDVASGNIGNKVSLQRFVLSVLLDDVLIQASQRLNLMSHGRYQLVRKEDRAKGNKASGLELEVEDGNTGKPRPVATLSGGESFMAALSLALGLSDVVQSYAGGIKLNTLFIDEGFGSLDMESLDAAIKVLIDLQARGRTIGIISHVSELKEQMALRVDVISSQSGSRISTIAA